MGEEVRVSSFVDPQAETRKRVRSQLNRYYLKLQDAAPFSYIDYSFMAEECKRPMPLSIFALNRVTGSFDRIDLDDSGIEALRRKFIGENDKYLVALNEGVDFTQPCPFDGIDGEPVLYMITCQSEEGAKEAVATRAKLLNETIRHRAVRWLTDAPQLNNLPLYFMGVILPEETEYAQRLILETFKDALNQLDPTVADFTDHFASARDKFFNSWQNLYEKHAISDGLITKCQDHFKENVYA